MRTLLFVTPWLSAKDVQAGAVSHDTIAMANLPLHDAPSLRFGFVTKNVPDRRLSRVALAMVKERSKPYEVAYPW